jgi:hypothetical protein
MGACPDAARSIQAFEFCFVFQCACHGKKHSSVAIIFHKPCIFQATGSISRELADTWMVIGRQLSLLGRAEDAKALIEESKAVLEATQWDCDDGPLCSVFCTTLGKDVQLSIYLNYLYSIQHIPCIRHRMLLHLFRPKIITVPRVSSSLNPHTCSVNDIPLKTAHRQINSIALSILLFRAIAPLKSWAITTSLF